MGVTSVRQSGSARPPRPAGVREVAALANVSLGTVSNVLNNRRRVNPETRARVQAAMSELGFVGSRAAGQLRSRRSALIGVVVPDVGNPYWASVLRGIETVVEREGLALVVGSTHQDPARQDRLLRGLESQGVDGLILAPIVANSEDWQTFAFRRYGLVALESRRSNLAVASVGLDDVQGARLAVTHLLSRGHRRIVFVNGPRSVPWCAERHEGVLAGLADHALTSDEVLLELEVGDMTADEGREAVAGLLTEGTDATAIMCANDMLALGALQELRSRGFVVPADFAVIGYDDVDFAAALAPPLTSVRQPSFEMGVAAATLLLKGNSRAPGEHIGFEPELMPRVSSDVVVTARV